MLVVACGRIGFEPSSGTPAGDGNSGNGGDGNAGDGAAPTLACADMNLGSALGPKVATGSTAVRDGSCTGPQLACSVDACGLTGLQGRVTVNLTAGQGIVIVIDSMFPLDGNYQLAITQQ